MATSARRTTLRLGFIPLLDAAPLFIASEKGMFSRHGLSVELSPEASWSTIRDKVALGALDGAHMLGTMPLATTLGLGNVQKPQVTALALNLNGNCITLANHVAARMEEIAPGCFADRPNSVHALRQVIDADKAAGRAPLTFAVTFPYSSHNYELRYWMAHGGIDPDADVRLIVVPPHRMVENLAAGNIDGYCVGDPWNQQAVLGGLGRIAVTTHELWNNRIEKVFGVNLDWAERHHEQHIALLMALIEAGHWLDEPENRLEAAHILSSACYVNAPMDVLKLPLLGKVQYATAGTPDERPDHIVFSRYAAAFPWRSQAEWFLLQMRRWGQLNPAVDISAAADAVYRTDLFRMAAAALGLPAPPIDRKPEGLHDSPWRLAGAEGLVLGPDANFDHSDPARPVPASTGRRDAIA
jgi:nitrate/nitrite transport system substrate-binding protein